MSDVLAITRRAVTLGNEMADAVPEPNAAKRGKLIYVSHGDDELAKQLVGQFILRGFQASLVPDLSNIMRLTAVRRPSLVVLPLCEGDLDCLKAVEILSAIRRLHLAIECYILVPEGALAQDIALAFRCGALEASSPPFIASEIVGRAEALLHGSPRKSGARSCGLEGVGYGALTFRERQVLQYVVEGQTNKEIALELGLSYRTIEVHRRNLIKKAGAKNTAELVRRSLKGIVPVVADD